MAKSKKKWQDGQKKVLVLSANYEVINFISDLRAVLMFLKDRVDVLDTWDVTFPTSSIKIPVPSVLKLKKQHQRRKNGPGRYYRTVVFRRDGWTCQYCSKSLTKRDATIDHVVPKCNNGPTNYKNCVTACRTCNHKKAFKTPEEAGMVLLSKPENPNILHVYNIDMNRDWHDGWNDYVGHLNVQRESKPSE